MRTYIKFLILIFFKSLIFVSLVLLSLIFILNILTELEFFKNIQVNSYYPIYIALLNSPAMLFEMFPFVFLLTTQVFFLNLINNNQIQIFKYSGLKNSKILLILSVISFSIGIFIIIFFYNFSSNLKNFYLEQKIKHTLDGKYLAVITNNGLWIKDIIQNEINIINASKIDQNYLLNVFITEFNEKFEVIKNIKSQRVDIKNKTWVLYEASIYEKDGNIKKVEKLEFNSNFDYQKIQSLYSNLSSLSLIELFDLRNNYKSLNYSTIEVDIQIQKILSYPLYFMLMTILAAILMFNTKKFKNTTLKLAIGLFMSVIIYYMNNFFIIMGNTEKIPVLISIWVPLIVLLLLNSISIIKINEK
jgi:lipopolysaccharide export system permease protein